MPLFGPPNIQELQEKRDHAGLLKALRYRRDASIRRAAAQALVDMDRAKDALDVLRKMGKAQAVAPLLVLLDKSSLASIRRDAAQALLACYKEGGLSAEDKKSILQVEKDLVASVHNDVSGALARHRDVVQQRAHHDVTCFGDTHFDSGGGRVHTDRRHTDVRPHVDLPPPPPTVSSAPAKVQGATKAASRRNRTCRFWMWVLILGLAGFVLFMTIFTLVMGSRGRSSRGKAVASPTPVPTPTRLPDRAPVAVRVWDGVAIETLCLASDLDFPQDDAGAIPDPMDQAVREVLSGLGIQIVDPGTPCDATMTLAVRGVATAGTYLGMGTCYTGGTVRGEIMLAAKGQEPFTVPILATDPVNAAIYGKSCASKSHQYGFRGLWEGPVMDALIEMWGPQTLVWSLHVIGREGQLHKIGPTDEIVRAMLYALEDEQGDVMLLERVAKLAGDYAPQAEETIPYLTRLALHKEERVRFEAIWTLGRYGPLAISAVPSLIEAMEAYSGGTARLAQTALTEITGQEIERDAARWRDWWSRAELAPLPEGTRARIEMPARPPTLTSVPTLTPTPVPLYTKSPTDTPAPALTLTPTRTSTPSPTKTPTSTPSPLPSPTRTAAPTATPTPEQAALIVEETLAAGSAVRSVALSPDGRTLAVGTEEDSVQLWDVAAGRIAHTLTGHTDRVLGVAFAPDGRTLASAGDDDTVRLWEAATGQAVHILQGHRLWVNGVAFSPDGKTLASGSADRTVRLWDVATGQELRVLEGHTDWVRSVAISPQGDLLAAGSCLKTESEGSSKCAAGEIRVWDLASGQVQQTLTAHEGWVQCLAFSPNGRVLASGSDDRTVRLWDLALGQETATLNGHKGWVNGLAFSPDGRLLASGSDDYTIKLWDTETGRALASLDEHTDWVSSVAFSQAGDTLASGSADGTVILWAVGIGQ